MKNAGAGGEGLLRVRPTAADVTDPDGAWEAFTPILPGPSEEIDRDANGAIRYAWRSGSRLFSPDETIAGVTDAERLTGHTTEPAPGSTIDGGAVGTISYSDFRHRFVRIMQEDFGSTLYAEADTPMGPWLYARRVAEHGLEKFYQPRMHPFLSREGGRILYFDGSFTAFDPPVPESPVIPRYEYNELRYKLDLADPRLVMPVPIYDVAEPALSPVDGVIGVGELITRAGLRASTPDQVPALYGHDRPTPAGFPGGVAVHWSDARCAGAVLRTGDSPAPVGPPLFYGVDATDPGGDPYRTLYRHTAAAGVEVYDTKPALAGFTSSPMVKVWSNPISVKLPVSGYLAPPVADAGSDRCVHLAGGLGTASVRVSGARTIAGLDVGFENAQALEYRWYAWSWPSGRGSLVAGGITPVIPDLAAGIHTFELVVTDPTTSKEGSDFVTVHVAPEADADADGVPDFRDNCTHQANPSQLDTDSDGFGNACDADLDQNGVVDLRDYLLFCDASDLCLPDGDSFALPEADFDGDLDVDADDLALLLAMPPVRQGPSGLACAGVVPCLDPVADADGDGVPNGMDDCSQLANADQRDTNGDGYGNACDADYDGDGDVDDHDWAIFQEAYGTSEGNAQYHADVDLDGDGVIGIADYLELTELYGKPPGPSGVSW